MGRPQWHLVRLTTEGWMVDVQDELCALPYDTYTLEELPCSANEGYSW